MFRPVLSSDSDSGDDPEPWNKLKTNRTFDGGEKIPISQLVLEISEIFYFSQWQSWESASDKTKDV